MRRNRSVRLSPSEEAQVKDASSEVGIPAATFIREAALEVADQILEGCLKAQTRLPEPARSLRFMQPETIH